MSKESMEMQRLAGGLEFIDVLVEEAEAIQGFSGAQKEEWVLEKFKAGIALANSLNVIKKSDAAGLLENTEKFDLGIRLAIRGAVRLNNRFNLWGKIRSGVSGLFNRFFGGEEEEELPEMENPPDDAESAGATSSLLDQIGKEQSGGQPQ